MKSLNTLKIFPILILLTGCLENFGGTETAQTDLNNSDFSVVTEPGTDDSSSSTGDGGGDTAPDLTGGFAINKGDQVTDSRGLILDFYPPFLPMGIKISTNASCVDGAWESFAPSKTYLSSLTNQNVILSVQYKDPDGALSPCYKQSILIDEIGPEILFAKYPSTPVEEGSDVEIVFTVTDIGVGVNSVTCKFAAITKSCGAGQNKLTFPKMASGTYQLEVSADDKLGHKSQNAINFTVSSLYKQMVQKVGVSEYQKVDILFVIDNSGSMAYEQKSMASRINKFLDVVKGLDWQIAITTTDARNVTLGDGRLVPLYGKSGQYILTSVMPDADARYTLGMTLQRPETGGSAEQGILTAYRAVERSMAAVGGNANFIRPDAQLAVVLISDEDESANTTKNDPATFVKFIQSSFNGQKAFSYHSVITRPGDTTCKSTQGYSYGYRYEQISKLTGGVIGDVCAVDYAAQVQGIAEGVRKTLKSITLACEPVINSSMGLMVMKDGQVYNATRQIQGMNVVFDEMLPAGSYEVHYSCLKN